MPTRVRKTITRPRRIRRKKFARHVKQRKFGIGRSFGNSDVSTRLVDKHPLPQRFLTKMVYADQYTLNTPGNFTSNFGTEQAFRLNSMYDPDFTGGGHQAYGWDQIAAMYNKYLVHAVFIDVMFCDPTTDGIVCGVQLQPPNDTNTISTRGLAHVREMPNVIIRQVNDSGSQRTMAKAYVPLTKLYGVKKHVVEANLSQYSSVVSGSPAIQTYMKLAIADLQATGSAKSVQALVKITFYVELYDRVTLNQSTI